MPSTRDVTEHHIKSFFDFDLEAMMSDYAASAILFTPDGPLTSIDAIGAVFQALIAEFRKPGMTFSMKRLSVEGDYSYALWAAETADNVYEVGTDTLIVRSGKIVAQSFAAKIAPKG